MKDKHLEILLMYLEGGYTHREVALATGYDRQSVKNIYNEHKDKLGLPEIEASRFCRNGHEYTQSSTGYSLRNGVYARYCKICSHQTMKKYRERYKTKADSTVS